MILDQLGAPLTTAEPCVLSRRHSCRLRFLISCLLVLCGLSLRAGETNEWLAGEDSWGGRPSFPAVVNPVVQSPLQTVLTLRGEWEFVAREVAPLRHPGWHAFFGKPWPGARKLLVPGCWEAQGVGEPGMGLSWDCKWDHCAKPIRHLYMGSGWYRKTLRVPEAWRGKRIWLKIGGVRSQGFFWVNQTPVAMVNNYCATVKYDITDLVKPGEEAVVVAEVNNVPPSRKGLFSSVHRFGGLYRDVELEATPDPRIDYAWVRGDFNRKEAEIHALVACTERPLTNPVLRVTLKTADGRPAGQGAQPVTVDPFRREASVVCRVPVTPFEPWSPETPVLYQAELVLCEGDQPIHGWVERFGIRKLEVRGDRFFLNGQPFFVRGYGDDFVYPLTLVSPASRTEHLNHLQAARQAGFNYVRLHTHCELPEFFEAADEAGILVQPELPYYGDYPTEAFPFDPIGDLKELVAHYRRHVSLATYCMGNEGLLGKPLGKEIYQLLKRIDPDRLVLHQDGTFNTAENSDFRNGPITVWEPGSFACDAPFVAHEYLNLSVKQDPRLAPKFSGVLLPPVPLETRDRWLTNAGLTRAWGDACQDASHGLQRYYQKAGLEAARMDPACDGYDFWTIVDVVVQQGNTYSAQGLFNPFWEPKPNGFTAEQFGRFNGPTVLLLKTDPASRIAVCGDHVQADFWISHYGGQTYPAAKLDWALRVGDTVSAAGECDAGRVTPGDVRSLAKVDLVIPVLRKPAHAVLEVSLRGGSVRNEWDFWLFPKRSPQEGKGIAVSKTLMAAMAPLYTNLVASDDPAAASADLFVSFLGSADVAPALVAGKRVILINQTTGKPNVSLGWWAMGEQVGTAFARHPALGDFPHQGYLSPLAFRILKVGRRLPGLGNVRPDEMFVVGEGAGAYYLYAAEARMGRGRAVLTFGLDLLSGFPEGTCILDGLIRYARSAAFDPKGKLAVPVSPNGWRKTLVAGDSDQAVLPPGCLQLDVARALKGKNELVWETKPVPENVRAKPTFSVTWIGGMGYFAEPAGSFALHLNDQWILNIPEISEQNAVWHNADRTVALKYERDPAVPEAGTLTLTVPSVSLEPGKPLRLKVVGSDSGSRRWFGVYQTP